MRHFPFVCALCFLALAIIADVAIRAASAHSAAVLADEENGAVRIVIDGQTIMTIAKTGVDVEGTLTATHIKPADRTNLPAPISGKVLDKNP